MSSLRSWWFWCCSCWRMMRLRPCSTWVLRMLRHLHCIQLIIPMIPRRRPCPTMWTCKRLKIPREFTQSFRNSIEQLSSIDPELHQWPLTSWYKLHIVKMGGFAHLMLICQAKRVQLWPIWPVILLQQHSWCICSSICGGVPRFQGICKYLATGALLIRNTLMMKWSHITEKENQIKIMQISYATCGLVRALVRAGIPPLCPVASRSTSMWPYFFHMVP